MKFGKRDKSIVDALFLLALFGVFLICALFIVLFGAKIYKNTVKASDDSFFERTSCTYITEKIRQNDNSNGIDISGTNDGSSVIELTRTAEGKDYVTYLFVNDGYLKEYTTSAGNELKPSIGTDILEVSSLQAEKLNDNLYSFTVTDPEGTPVSFCVSLSSDIASNVMLTNNANTADDTNTTNDADTALYSDWDGYNWGEDDIHNDRAVIIDNTSDSANNADELNNNTGGGTDE